MMKKNLLVVIDFQNDFVDGALGFPKAQAIDKKIASKINDYRSKGYDVLFTYDTHYENYLETQEGKKLPVPHCIYGTFGHDIYGLTKATMKDEDKKIIKTVFGSKELGFYLEQNKYEKIEFVGVVTNICVISNVVIARTFSQESAIVVDCSCVASNDDSLNNKCLDVLESLQVELLNR